MRTLYGASKEQRIAARWIPAGAVAIERPGGVVYTHERTGPDNAVRYCAVAYRGTAGKSEWNHYYRTPEQRQAKIDEFFSSIQSWAAHKQERKQRYKAEAEQNPGSKTGEYSLTETAQLVRNVLKEVFPKTKFSVRSSSYSGGCSIDFRWTDGPTEAQVRPILNRFQGADFDGMQDLKTYRDGAEWNGKRVRFHVDFVHGQRSVSHETVVACAKLVAKHTGLPELEVVDGQCRDGGQQVPWHYRDGVFAHDSHGGEWYSQLVYQVAHQVSQEQPAARPELPREVTPAYIDDVVARMLEWVA